MRLPHASIILLAAMLPLVAVAATESPGKTDICYSVSIKEANGTAAETYSKAPDDGCETLRKKYDSDKSACQNASFRDVVGDYQYTDSMGKVSKGNRCDHLPGSTSGAPPISSATLSSETLKTMNALNTDDQTKMSDMLQTLGASPAQAQTAVETKPQETLDFLNQVVSDNASAADQPFAKEFNLDPQLIKNVGQIQPDINQGEFGAGGDYGGGGDANTSGNNSGSTCGYSGTMDKIMLPESGCGKNLGSGTYQGPIQASCDWWDNAIKQTGMTQYSDCSNRMDPAVATQVGNQLYDQYQQKYGSTCDSIGATWNSCALAIHACGVGGFQQMVSAAQDDASASGLCSVNKSYMTKYNPDGTAKGAFASLDQFMNCGWSCNSPGVVTPGKYLGSTDTATSLDKPFAVNYGSSDLGTFLAGPQLVKYTDSSGNITYRAANPSSNNSFQSQLQQMLLMNMVMNSLKNLFGGASAPTSPTSATPPPPPPTAAISALPNPVHRGSQLTVSWSSNGTSLQQPCVVRDQNGITIGTSNGSTQSLYIGSTTPAMLTFTAYCIGVTGQQVQQSSSVTVQ